MRSQTQPDAVWCATTQVKNFILTNYLGGVLTAGGKMKETGTFHWQTPNTAETNEGGFTARPGSTRGNVAGFFDLCNNTCFWSSTLRNLNFARYRGFTYDLADVYRNNLDKGFGFSVRCVKD